MAVSRFTALPFFPAAALAHAVEIVRPEFGTRGVHLEIDVDLEAGPVLGDSDRLRDALCVLLSNAARFTSAGGRVTASVARTGACVEIAVRDTGVGVARERLARLFDGPTTDSSGLASVREAVEAHGGTVYAESDGEGRGAAFIAVLPATPAAATADADDAPLAGLRVLVVEDHDDTRGLLTFALEKNGATVVATPDAKAALAELAGSRFDVLVSDIGLPLMNGYGLIQRLRMLEHEPNATIPALALTAFASEYDRTKALATGFQAHLTKPVEPRELVRAIVSLASRAGSQ